MLRWRNCGSGGGAERQMETMESLPVEAGAAATTASPAGWTAIVLAGDRPERDLLAERFGAEAKALVPIAGEAMIARVVRTLLGSPSVRRVLVLAQQPGRLAEGATRWLAEEPRVALGVSRSTIAESVAGVAGSNAAPWPVLVTTADHPLLTRDMVEYFIARSAPAEAALGVVERDVMLSGYPGTRRTWIRFKGGAYTGANLFALTSSRAGEGLARLAKAEADRKKPIRLLWQFGPALAFGAATRSISLADATARAGKKLGVAMAAVELPMADAGIDVDKVADHRLVEQILAGRDGRAAAARALPHEAISIFDVDRTLTRRGTYSAFLAYAAWRHAPWRLALAPAAALVFLAHKAGFVSRKRLKERMQLLLIGRRVDRDRIAAMAGDFAERIAAGGLYRDAVSRIERERREGRKIVLASAANAFYLRALADRLGIAEVVCTQSGWDGDALLPTIAGANCYGDDKLAMLRQWLADAGLGRDRVHVRFFTDHQSDACTLDWADEAYVVNPGAKLRGMAERKGWEVLRWT